MVAADEDFSLRRIERYLACVRQARAEAVLLLNKIDKADDLMSLLETLRTAARTEPILAISVLEKQGLELLEPYLQCTIAFTGSSGVGKSSPINAILGHEVQAHAEVRSKDSKGRHTTTRRDLIVLAPGVVLIDNPGMREIQIWAEGADVGAVFADVEMFAQRCRYRDCRHQREPGCAVQEALKWGELEEGRVQSYLRLLSEATRVELTRWQQIKKEKELRARWALMDHRPRSKRKR